jgi:hypothetical protein
VRGALGTVIAIAASISTTATGFLFEALGNWEGFLILAAASVIATALLWVACPKQDQLSISIDCRISGVRVAVRREPTFKRRRAMVSSVQPK